jgi:hypothetical protein
MVGSSCGCDGGSIVAVGMAAAVLLGLAATAAIVVVAAGATKPLKAGGYFKYQSLTFRNSTLLRQGTLVCSA